MNFLKRRSFVFSLCVSLVSVIGFASAMDPEQKEDTHNVKATLINLVDKAFTLPESNRFYLSEDGKGIPYGNDYSTCGYVYFPQNLISGNDFIHFIGEARVPRNKMTLKDYIYHMRDNNNEITMIIGSGLTQATIQPTSNIEFQNAFFVDASDVSHPDIVSKCDLNFAYREDVIYHQGTVDAIYLDNFPGMYNEEVLQAATLMLKENGKIMMSYRPGSVVLEQNHINCLQSLEMSRHYSDIKKDIEIKPLLSHIEKCGFKGVNQLNDRLKIRPYGYSPYVIYGYKK